MPVTTWKTHPRHRNYEVSDTGRVRRATRGPGTFAGRELRLHVRPTQRPNGTFYPRVMVCLPHGKHGRLVPIGRLVLETFVGPAPKGRPFACHKDDNPFRNSPDNLYWGSKSSNGRDAYRNGKRQPRGKQKEKFVVDTPGAVG